MVEGVFLLLACQLAGDALTRAAGLPLPGPVLGLGLLFALLAWRGRSRADATSSIGPVADGLVGHLSLLFVPAAVGVMQHGALLRDNAVAIAAALVTSTLAALVVTALVFRAVSAFSART